MTGKTELLPKLKGAWQQNKEVKHSWSLFTVQTFFIKHWRKREIGIMDLHCKMKKDWASLDFLLTRARMSPTPTQYTIVLFYSAVLKTNYRFCGLNFFTFEISTCQVYAEKRIMLPWICIYYRDGSQLSPQIFPCNWTSVCVCRIMVVTSELIILKVFLKK